MEDKYINRLRTGKFEMDSAVTWQDAVFTVTAENTNVGNVSVQLKDGNGNNLTNTAVVDLYISNTAGGVEAATGPDGTVVIGTDGVLINTIVTKKNYRIQSDSTGLFDLDITETGTASFYVNLIHPVTGKISSSAVMTFAA